MGIVHTLPFVYHLQIDASRQQIGIDVFATGSEHMDLLTLSHLAKYSSGSVYYYPTFAPSNTGLRDLSIGSTDRPNNTLVVLFLEANHKFKTELGEMLRRPIGLEVRM